MRTDKISNYIYKAKVCINNRLFKARPDYVFSYPLLLDRTDYQIYKRAPGQKRIECAHESVVVLSHKRRLIIYPDYRYPKLKYSVKFDAEHFPDLISGSNLAYCRVLPYYRWISARQKIKAWRLMVVTDKGQIYHNYPSRCSDCDGKAAVSDIVHFEESVVWDLPMRKFPTPNKECAAHERYYPGLPPEAYVYHPAVNKKSPYGNLGFGATCPSPQGTIGHFYISRREAQGNPFYYMSGFCADSKMALIATYRGNLTVGVRTCIFASDDGGRQWYCKYEFGDLGEYQFQQGTSEWGRNFGHPIRCDADVEGMLALRKRNCVLPNGEEKEPKQKFLWSELLSFSFESKGGRLMLTSEEPHLLETGNIVCISTASESLNWMVNSEVDEVSAGNGLLFKVEKVSDRVIQLYEFVASPDNSICCRHIHHINRIRDGWMIGTGEIYPNSWILYMQMKEADTFSEKSAADHFDIYRLNSSECSVQRTLGVLWSDDEENTLLYASDHDVLEQKQVFTPIKGRTVAFSRNATGIYRGRLTDIDDYNCFIPVFEAKEPAYLLQKLDHAIVFSGQRGEIALSFDGGEHWSDAHIDGALNHPKGCTYQYHIFDDYLLKIQS